MDKKLNRQVGYQRPKVQDLTKPTYQVNPITDPRPTTNYSYSKGKKVTVLKEDVVVMAPGTSKKVVDWVNSHPGINKSWLCAEVGVDKSNFNRILKTAEPVIKPELLVKIVGIIKEYGFK